LTVDFTFLQYFMTNTNNSFPII